MWNDSRLPILVVLGLLGGASVVAKKYNVTVGYLPCITGEVRDRQGITISGALTLALEEINNNTELLPDVKLLMKWNDTRCDPEIGTKLITDMSDSGVVAFFGPESKCQKEAIIAHNRNLPMISYKCFDYQNSTLSNFLRMNPSETQAIKSVISLLRYYRWNKFSILYEEPWLTIASTLRSYAENNNMTVYQQLVRDSYTCCEEMMSCCESKYLPHLIKETKKRARIYVFLGSTTGLLELMTTMESLQLFETGEYMVIFVEMMTSSHKETMKYLIPTENRVSPCPNTSIFRKRGRSLLVVGLSAPGSNYDYFTSRVRKYTSMEPFKFPQPNRFIKFVSIYAAYLYDSLKLYATALHRLIEDDTTQKNLTLTYERLMNIATNGSRIVSKMISITPMKSVSGMNIRLDKRAENMGNFSLLAFKPNTNSSNDNCPYSMLPVANFQWRTKEFPEYKINPRMPIDWPDDGVKPEDEPTYGFLNENRPKTDSQVTMFVVVGSLGIILFCALCIFFIILFVKKVKRRTSNNRRTARLLAANT